MTELSDLLVDMEREIGSINIDEPIVSILPQLKGWMDTIRMQGNGGLRPFIEDTETGIVVNRASGFTSDWESFDVEQPGVGYGKATLTAADGDGLEWGVGEGSTPRDIAPGLEIDVSADGSTWIHAYGSGGTMAIPLDVSALTAADPTGDSLAYMSMTARYIRFRAILLDQASGEVYTGADDPSFTFTLYYTAG